jgi:asparagine synthase (glutamine-hydrolysing)
MCGIAGALVLEPDKFRLSLPYLKSMADALAHRGPDGEGVWLSTDGMIGLAHRRLAIIDLSETAAQPMQAADERVWISFNGEIYNHREIRRELVALGHRNWRSDHSDTETILRAYIQWGTSCVHHLRGMFAFALWDGRSKELWLVRDRLGIKPLYYTIHHGRLAFASEIKALLTDPRQPRVADEEAFFHYLSFLAVPAPGTMFKGVRKLEAASWLRASSDGTLEERRYWDPVAAARREEHKDEDSWAHALVERLKDSVRVHAESDVPVGIFLSGGVDSSTNAALFSRAVNARVRTFSVGYAGDNPSYPSELEFARRVAMHVGAEHHEIVLRDEDLLSFLPRMVHLQDEPIADPVCVPVYYVSKLARDHGVKVCQVGEGADELFCGYAAWATMLNIQKMDRLPVPKFVKRAGLMALSALGQGDSFRYEWLRRGANGVPIFWGGAEAFTEAQKQKLLGARLKPLWRGRNSWEAIEPIWRRFVQAGGGDDLAWMSYLDLNFRLPELLLMRVDKMSMGAGLEGRVPFLDHQFVEFALGIPSGMKYFKGDLKHILKRAIEDLVPAEVIRRPKQGFGVPLREWIKGKLGAEAQATLRRFCRKTDLLDAKEVERVLARGEPNKIWYLLNIALWWESYAVT